MEGRRSVNPPSQQSSHGFGSIPHQAELTLVFTVSSIGILEILLAFNGARFKAEITTPSAVYVSKMASTGSNQRKNSMVLNFIHPPMSSGVEVGSSLYLRCDNIYYQ